MKAMPENNPTLLVNTAWLDEHLASPDIRIIDVSWYFLDTGRDARAEYEAAHIPRAVFFDLDEISDRSSLYPHMMPSPDEFQAKMRALGLSNDNRIVAYDGEGLFSAARAWWMLRVMGQEKVAVLDGGLPR